MKTISIGLIVAGLVTLFGATASADDEKKEKKVAPSTKEEGGYVTEKRGDTTIKYKKKTSYDFEGANIEGLYNKPSGSYISNIKDVKGKSILRIREIFDAEVIDSSRQLR